MAEHHGGQGKAVDRLSRRRQGQECHGHVHTGSSIRIILFALLVMLLATGADFNGDGPINVTEAGIAVKGYDVVAYFTEDRPRKGSAAFEVEYRNARFRFASAKNRERFLEMPARYLPAYGGYCALGVANGYKDDMHPEAYAIIDGRLFFNLSPSIQEYWNAFRQRYHLIERADANWPDLRYAKGYGPADAR